MIRRVLLVVPIHLLAATNPPKDTVEIIEKSITRFFWSGLGIRGEHHWSSWRNFCHPYSDGVNKL